MRRAMECLLAVLLLIAALPAAAGAEALQAPDYVMEGYDADGANHDWETNLFLQRMQEETGIRFEYRQRTNEEQWTARKTEIAEGKDLPDVLFKAELKDEEILDMAESGVIIDLKPYLEEYAPDLWKLLQENPAWMEAITLPDGTIRTLPSINELPGNNLMWINTAWLKNVRMEVPGTAEELTEVLRAFKSGDPNRNGRADEIPLSVLGMWDLRFLGHAFGIVENDYYLSVKDGKVQSSLTGENNRAFLGWLHQLWQEDLLSHLSFSTADTLRQITDSKAAITYGMFLSNTPLAVVPNTALEQYALLEPMSFDGAQSYRDLLGPLTRGTFALTRICPSPEKMIAWVNRLYTPEGSILMQAGREGEEYLWTEEGTWEWMEDLQTVANEILPNATLSDGGAAPGIVGRDFQAKYADTATRRLVESMIQAQKYAVFPCPLVSFTREDAKAAAELQARIAPYAEKTMAGFVTGDIPLNDENWDLFCGELEERGLEQMISLWQKYIKQQNAEVQP